MIILAVDHGIKNIGIAVCDELGIAARALTVIPHRSKQLDSEEVSKFVSTTNAQMVLVGVSYNEVGEPNDAGRRALNFIAHLKDILPVPILEWDESLTTQDARALKIEMGYSKKKRKGHHDSSAAAVLLQNYLDSTYKGTNEPK